MSGKPGKKPIKSPDKLTEKQQSFVNNLMNEGSETFADIVKSLIASGYKHGREPKITAVNLLANRNILNALLLRANALNKTSIIRAESAKERIWQELEEALSDCKTAGDMTNRIRVIELMGKYHDLWQNKLTVSIESCPVLSAEDRKYLAELSRLHLASGTPKLIDACFSPVSEPIGAQDVVGDGDDTQAISDNQVDDCTVDGDNTSNINDLQSNESESLNATE